MSEPLPIAWLTTGRGPGSYGALEYLLRAIDRGLAVRVAVVFVNRDRGEYEATDRLMALAQKAGAAVETLSSVRFRKEHSGKLSRPGEPLQPWRLEYDSAVAERLARYDFRLGLMFGYMLIATEMLYSRFPFINDHPALPDGPVGTYQEVIVELIRQGARESGCMMNIVTGDLDRGPVLSLCRYSIRDAANEHLWSEASDLAGRTREETEASGLYADIRARGVARERPFVVETLRAIAEGRLEVPSRESLDLSREVEALVAGSS